MIFTMWNEKTSIVFIISFRTKHQIKLKNCSIGHKQHKHLVKGKVDFEKSGVKYFGADDISVYG